MPPVRPGTLSPLLGGAAGAALLALAGLLAAPAAEARLEQSVKPPETAERGGQGVSPGARPPPGCLGAILPGIDFALLGPFTLGGACFGLQQAEESARFAAAQRLFFPDRTAAWRAPRLAARVALLRRLQGERQRGTFPHRP